MMKYEFTRSELHDKLENIHSMVLKWQQERLISNQNYSVQNEFKR